MESDASGFSIDQQILPIITMFDRALGDSDVELAKSIAMAAAEQLLTQDVEAGRYVLWNNFFSKLTESTGTQYQWYDFEIADYKLYRALPLSPLMRGPRPELNKLTRGRYVTFFGAAQLFGRFQQNAPHSSLDERLDLAGLNLSFGGAGPETFLRKKYLRLANGAKALVLQVLSGRSIGCDEYPGTRLTYRKGERKTQIDRLKLLKEIWTDSREEAIRLVAKWQGLYLSAFESIVAETKVPIILAWISDRTPDDWSIDRMTDEPDFGRFPQLVDQKMMSAMAAHSAAVVEVTGDPGLPHELVSRFTGEKCPAFRPSGKVFWENKYYPSEVASAEIGQKIADALDALNIAG